MEKVNRKIILFIKKNKHKNHFFYETYLTLFRFNKCNDYGFNVMKLERLKK